jgi:hypothetical protein
MTNIATIQDIAEKVAVNVGLSLLAYKVRNGGIFIEATSYMNIDRDYAIDSARNKFISEGYKVTNIDRYTFQVH